MAEPLKIKDLPIDARPLAAAFALVRRTVRASHRSFARSVDTPEAVVRQVRSIITDDRQEQVLVLYLDSQRHLLCEPAVVSRGTADRALIHPREIFRNAIKLGAISVVVVHNHPGGCADPSDEDIELTKRLVEAGHCVGIPLDDHIVIAKDSWVSMRETSAVEF